MADNKGKKYVPVPGDNTTRWLFLGALSTDKRRRLTHMMVGWHILEAWWDKFENCRAGVTFLQNGTGLTRGAIATATAELVNWGYFKRRMGEGKRPTEYFPNWSIVLQPSDANASVLQLRDPWVLPSQDANSDSVLQSADQPHLLSPLTAALTYSVNKNTHGAATPPLLTLSGAKADSPRDPEEGFEPFWKVFPRKHYRTATEAAWAKLNPDAELAALILQKATELASHYSAHPVDKKWMPTPAKWLAGKRWLEDLPAVYADPKEAAIAKAKDRPKKPKPTKAKPVADNDNNDDMPEEAPEPAWVGDVGPFSPTGSFITTITGSEVEWLDENNEQVKLHLAIRFRRTDPHQDITHTFFSQSSDSEKQDRGQMFLATIARCLDIHDDVNETDIFHGKELRCRITKQCEITYQKLPVFEPYVLPVGEAA